MEKFGIGQPVSRKEDPRLVTGRGRYTDDINLENQARMYVVRATHAHAELGTIGADVARAAPGVLAVLTGDELVSDGLGNLPCIYRVDNIDGSQKLLVKVYPGFMSQVVEGMESMLRLPGG